MTETYEQQKKEEENKQQETTISNTNNGVSQTSTTSLLEQVRQERERADITLAEIRNERLRIEELQARELLSGKAERKEKKEEELDPIEYAEKALAGKIK